MRRLLERAGIAAIVLSLCALVHAQDASPDEFIVKVRPGSENDVRALTQQMSGRVVEQLPQTGMMLIRLSKGASVSNAMRRMSQLEGVAFAEPNYFAEAYFTPNDPSFGSQWGLPKISAPQAWDLTTGSSSVKIAIIDTGVDLTHPDLAGKILPGYDFVNSDTVAQDDNGHGTHCAGIAAAITNNAAGVAGVGYDCSIMPVKVLNSSGSGTYAAIVNGIVWATDHGANVISMSLGGTSGSSALQDAVDYAWSHGVVVVAAAGNSNSSSPSYPAYYENCIAVGSTDSLDARSSFSNYGDWVDVAAPGSSVFSTYLGGGYATLSGTSMATPHVAGLAGLLWSSLGSPTAAMVRSRIESTTDSVGSWLAHGRINCLAALSGSGTNYTRLDFQASSYSLLRGRLIRGGLERTFTSDNKRMEFLSERTGSPRAVEVTFSGYVSWTGDLASLEVGMEANLAPTGDIPVYIWNFETGQWDSFQSLSLTTRDKSLSLAISSSPSAYVGGDGEVRVRLYRQLDRRTHWLRIDLIRFTTVAAAGG